MSKEEIKIKALELALAHCLSGENKSPPLTYSVKVIAKEYMDFVLNDED